MRRDEHGDEDEDEHEHEHEHEDEDEHEDEHEDEGRRTNEAIRHYLAARDTACEAGYSSGMLRIACLALSLLLAAVLPLGAQTVNPRMAARVSEKNLTRGQRKLGDDLWVGLFMELGKPLPKTVPLSLAQAAAFLGSYRAHDDSTTMTLTFAADGTWKITGTAFGSPMDPETGRWVLRRNRIEVWDENFGDPAGDNNALRSEVFQKGKQWYAIEIGMDGGVVKLTKVK